MKKYQRGLSFFLTATLVLGMVASPVYAAKPGDTLSTSGRFVVDSQSVRLANGITETTITTNNNESSKQNIDYVVEIDPKVKTTRLMAGYGDYNAGSWKLKKITDQADAAQKAFKKDPSKYPNYKVVGVLNADFYNMGTGQPVGALVMDGKICNSANGRPYFAMLNNGEYVIRTDDDLSDVQEAVGGSVYLVQNGIAENITDEKITSRTAVGIKNDGTIVTLVTRGYSPPLTCGYTLAQLAEMMVDMGCETALNLDSSGSSSYASCYEGEKKIAIRNSPSDGGERYVSSSILLVSTEAPSGTFDHAVISPSKTFYTPNKTIDFSAKYVDSSGATVSEVPELTWDVSNSDMGTISDDGKFQPSGKEGQVTVFLKDKNGKHVGEQTVQLVQPDEIKFDSQEVTLGFNEESDLGIQLRYQGAPIIYDPNDIQWTISDVNITSSSESGESLGSISEETNLFISAKATSGTCKVTASVGSLSASVSVEVGKAPVVVMDFEDFMDGEGKVTSAENYWNIGRTIMDGYKIQAFYKESGEEIDTDVSKYTDKYRIVTGHYVNNRKIELSASRGGNESAEIVRREDGYPVRFGNHSLKLNYDFTKTNGVEGASIGFSSDVVIPGSPTALGVWAYIPEGTPNYWLRVAFDVEGSMQCLNFTEEPDKAYPKSGGKRYGGVADYADDNWHYFEVDLSQWRGSQIKLAGGEAIRLMDCYNQYGIASGVGAGSHTKDGIFVDRSQRIGSIYVDNLQFVYGTMRDDVTSPEITNVTTVDGEKNDVESVEDNTEFKTHELNFAAYFKDADAEIVSGIDYDNVYAYIDGVKSKNAVVDHTLDCVYFSSDLSNGTHRMKVLVTDGYGNQTVKTILFTVNDPQNTNDVSVTVEKGAEKATVAASYDFKLKTSDLSKIKSVTATVQATKSYKKCKVEPVEGFDVSEITSNDVYNTYTFTLTKKDDALKEIGKEEGELATVSFEIPATAAVGGKFEYSVPEGSFTLSDDRKVSFASPQYSAEITAPYSVSSDVLIAQDKETKYFHVTDEDGKPASGVDVYLDERENSETSIGQSNSDGKVEVPIELLSKVQSYKVYAKGSAGVSSTTTGYVLAAGGKEDGSPEMILNNAVSDGSSQKNVTWLSNPLTSTATPKLQYAEKAAYDKNQDEVQFTTVDGTQTVLSLAGYGTQNVSGNYAVRSNRVKLTGLDSSKEYVYRVGDGTHWSDVTSFTLTDKSSLETDFFVLGDIQATDTTNIETILSELNKGDYDLGIQTGDFVDKADIYEDWCTNLGLLDGLDGTDVLHTLGNHDITGDTDNFDITRSIFGMDDPKYYSVEYGCVYIASISYGVGADYEKALNWLVTDAQRSNATWKILTIHQPAYYTNDSGGNEVIHDMLPAYAQKAGIDIVFSGHDHSYARTSPMIDGKVDEDGVVYYICASSGEKSYTVSKHPEFNFEQVNGDYNAVYLTVKADNNEITVNAYDLVDGTPQEIDTYTKKYQTDCGDQHQFLYNEGYLQCQVCGYRRSIEGYTGLATIDPETNKQVYFYLGEIKTGWIVNGDQYYHAGDDGILHKTIQNEPKCREYWYTGAVCEDDGEAITGHRENPQGHDWDEHHICNRCTFRGIDISSLDISLNSSEWTWSGNTIRPIITIMDGGKKLTRAVSIGSGVGDYYSVYPATPDVGTATITVMGMVDYYGETEISFEVVPPAVTNLTSAWTTSDSLGLKWDAAHGATYYRVSVYDESKDTYYYRYTTTDTEITIEGLQPGKEYTYRVRAYAEIDGKTYTAKKSSDSLTVTTEGSSDVTFSGGNKVNRTFGDEGFVSIAKDVNGSSDGFIYSSSNPNVANVDQNTGEVTIHHAGVAVISATKGDKTGQYRLTVEPKAVGLKWSGTEERTYDGTASNVTAVVNTGLLGSDEAEVTVSGGAKKDAGEHTAVASGISNPDYALPEENSCSYKINPKKIRLKWGNTDLTYSGEMQAPVPAVSDGLVEGDEISFAVSQAKEPGTYRTKTVSENPNYIVSDGAETKFSIVFPDVTLENEDGGELAYYMDGMTIHVVGIGSSVKVTLDTKSGSSASETVQLGETTPINIGGVTYTVDGSGLVNVPIDLKNGSTIGSVADEKMADDAIGVVKSAVNDQHNRFQGILAAIAGKVSDLIAGSDEENLVKPDSELEVSMNLEALEYEANEKYVVDIKPMYVVRTADGKALGESQVLPNDKLNTPVRVSLRVPDGITLNENTYIKHQKEDGTVEYIKPLFIRKAEDADGGNENANSVKTEGNETVVGGVQDDSDVKDAADASDDNADANGIEGNGTSDAKDMASAQIKSGQDGSSADDSAGAESGEADAAEKAGSENVSAVISEVSETQTTDEGNNGINGNDGDMPLNTPADAADESENGGAEYIGADENISSTAETGTGDGQIVTFETTSFSIFTIYNDSRSATVTFNYPESDTGKPDSKDSDDTTLTQIFGPSDIGKPLPSLPENAIGWSINGKVYTVLDENLLNDSETPLTAEPAYAQSSSSSSTASSSTGGSASYSITVSSGIEHGTISVSPKKASKGSRVTVSVKPEEGYVLDTLVAKDSSGKNIELNDNRDGTYTFEMPASDVKISAVFREEKDTDTLGTVPVASFSQFVDLNPDYWYAEGIEYVLSHGMMNGTSETTFEPDTVTTRSMLVTILYRLDGSPKTGEAGFGDVTGNTWYSAAVAWAKDNGIVIGYENGNFGPNDVVTREQTATILYRYAAYKNYSRSDLADLGGYADAGSISLYAQDAMRWANAKGLIKGTTSTTLTPGGEASRAEIATMLMRFCEEAAK